MTLQLADTPHGTGNQLDLGVERLQERIGPTRRQIGPTSLERFRFDALLVGPEWAEPEPLPDRPVCECGHALLDHSKHGRCHFCYRGKYDRARTLGRPAPCWQLGPEWEAL